MSRHAKEVPWLGKRGGVYNVFWHVPTQRDPVTGAVLVRRHTKRLGLRTRDPVEAQKRYVAFLQQGTDVVAGVERASGLTVKQALDDYFREHVTAKDEKGNPRVVDVTRQENAIRHLKNWFGDTVLNTIGRPECDAYIEARRSGQIGGGKRRKGAALKKGSFSTIRRELVVLQAAAYHAESYKRVGTTATPPTPMPVIYKPSEADYAEEAEWLRKSELALVLANATGRLRDFIVLAYWWGARRGWVERLHVDQVDLETGFVDAMRPGEKRTKKRRGIVPVFDDQRPVLERLCAEAQKGDGYLFGRNVDFYRPFRELLDTLGLEGRSNPHVLRHSRATHMLMDKEGIYEVAKLLHDSPNTVARVYGHHSWETQREEAA